MAIAECGTNDMLVDWDEPIATDNCEVASIGSDMTEITSPHRFDVGTNTTITYTATDACGITATCALTISVGKYFNY